MAATSRKVCWCLFRVVVYLQNALLLADEKACLQHNCLHLRQQRHYHTPIKHVRHNSRRGYLLCQYGIHRRDGPHMHDYQTLVRLHISTIHVQEMA